MEEIDMKAFMKGSTPQSYKIAKAQEYGLPSPNYFVPNMLEKYNLTYR
jgi:hypothetical protein